MPSSPSERSRDLRTGWQGDTTVGRKRPILPEPHLSRAADSNLSVLLFALCLFYPGVVGLQRLHISISGPAGGDSLGGGGSGGSSGNVGYAIP
ncbi:MAG: hypothetical protein ACYS21_12300, partial [Planctomycetota bacterium]